MSAAPYPEASRVAAIMRRTEAPPQTTLSSSSCQMTGWERSRQRGSDARAQPVSEIAESIQDAEAIVLERVSRSSPACFLGDSACRGILGSQQLGPGRKRRRPMP